MGFLPCKRNPVGNLLALGIDFTLLCSQVGAPHSPKDGDVSETASLLTNDEGFGSECGSHEEQQPIMPKHLEAFLSENGLDQLTVAPTLDDLNDLTSSDLDALTGAATTPSATSTNHRTMLKPSDVKSRSNRNKTKSDLSIVEEHEVSVNEAGRVKKITHWTVPFV